MAYQNPEHYLSVDRVPFSRCIPEIVGEKTIAAIGAAPTLTRLMPMAYNTSTNKWVVWTNGGANGTGTILAFIWPDEVPTDAANDTLAVMLLAGELHFDDIPVPSGETSANLKTALRSGPRTVDFTIRGLDQVR